VAGGGRAKAIFDVDHLRTTSPSRTSGAAAHGDGLSQRRLPRTEEISLRGSTDEVSKALQQEVQERVAPAGGGGRRPARPSGYAPEIAGAMLQRQQRRPWWPRAPASSRARSACGDGAGQAGGVQAFFPLDDERKAAMVTTSWWCCAATSPPGPW
jgi:hypothetical protein